MTRQQIVSPDNQQRMTIRDGDVYCPHCGDPRIGLDITFEHYFWTCSSCGHEWDWDHTGVDWVWPEGTAPTPGCPWCGTQNIRWNADSHMPPLWWCCREACARQWHGGYVVRHRAAAPPVARWTIRIPARDVPFRRTLDNPTTYPHP